MLKRKLKHDESHLCLLRDYDTARKIKQAIEELDVIVCRTISEHIKNWIDDNLENKWEGISDLHEEGQIAIWKNVWVQKDGGYKQDEPLAMFSFGIEEDTGNLWLEHLLGLSKVPFAAFYDFKELTTLLGNKQKALALTEEFDRLLENDGFTSVKKKKLDLRFWMPIELDPEKLAIALENEDPEEALIPINKMLEHFKSNINNIDKIVSSAIHDYSTSLT